MHNIDMSVVHFSTFKGHIKLSKLSILSRKNAYFLSSSEIFQRGKSSPVVCFMFCKGIQFKVTFTG